MRVHKDAVLVVGDEKLAFSVAVCLMQGKHPVTLYTKNSKEAGATIDMHLADLADVGSSAPSRGEIEIVSELNGTHEAGLAIVISPEDAVKKKALLAQLESHLSSETLIAVNTESIPLSQIQEGTTHPRRIIGANWRPLWKLPAGAG